MPVGHPPKLKKDQATLKTLEGLGTIHASLREAAAVLGVTHQSLMAFFHRWPPAEQAYESGKEKGRLNLRRLQFQLAQKNAGMAIFLGKNLLGQSDRQEHEHVGRGGGPIQTLDLTKCTDEQLAALEPVLAALAAASPNPGAGSDREET